MIKAVIFDFDGVILESTQVKIDAFREMFKGYPEQVDAIVDYHIDNGGISRFVKFKHIYKNMIHEPLSDVKEQELGDLFTELSLQRVLTVPYVDGAQEFLESERQNYKFFVASGTPDDELTQVVQGREMQKHFDGVYGSPETKFNIIQMILSENQLSKDEVVFVGDANSDRLAAREADVDFVFRVYEGERDTGDQWIVDDLTPLKSVIQKIEQARSMQS